VSTKDVLGIVPHIEDMGSEYAIVGGLAAIAWGMPRFNQGVDLMAELSVDLHGLIWLGQRMSAAGLSVMEPDHFAEVATSRIGHGVSSSFVTPAVTRLTFLRSAPRLRRAGLCLCCRLETAGGRTAWFATPESTIIGKLCFYWFVSDRQMRDIANVLQVQAGAGRGGSTLDCIRPGLRLWTPSVWTGSRVEDPSAGSNRWI